MATTLGIDIGGTGIKGAPVDSETGELIAPRRRILTPHPATPEAVASVVAEIAKHFDWTGHIGATFPAVVTGGVVRTAANVDKAWIGTNAAETFAGATRAPVTVLNDADAAGYRRDGVRRRQGTRRHGDRRHARHRHRQCSVQPGAPRTEHRARPPPGAREGSRAARVRGRPRGAEAVVEEVGEAPQRVLRRCSKGCCGPTSSSSVAA